MPSHGARTGLLWLPVVAVYAALALVAHQTFPPASRLGRMDELDLAVVVAVVVATAATSGFAASLAAASVRRAAAAGAGRVAALGVGAGALVGVLIVAAFGGIYGWLHGAGRNPAFPPGLAAALLSAASAALFLGPFAALFGGAAGGAFGLGTWAAVWATTRPRLSLRALMIAVALAGLAFALAAQLELRPTALNPGGPIGGMTWLPRPGQADPVPGIDQGSISRAGTMFVLWCDRPNMTGEAGIDGSGFHCRGAIPGNGGSGTAYSCQSRDGKTGRVTIGGSDYNLSDGALFLVSGGAKGVRVRQLKRDLGLLGMDLESARAFAAGDPDIQSFFARPGIPDDRDGVK